ncbi:MAG: ribosomal protein [Pseudonocardia sp.]|nr:ribosomal protein [Pseudonocardia sp.]
MARPDKVAAVEEIADRFRGSNASVVTEFRGLTVSQLKALRRALMPGATYQVAKNTLVRRAAADAGVSGLDELLVGPTAIAFVTGEAVDAAKALRNFARDNKALVIKGGIMDGRPLTVAEVNQLADLESREVLLAKLAGAMMGNLAKAAALFAAPASQLARLAAALGDKRAAAGETSTEAATDPATETTETDTTDTTDTTDATQTTEPEPAAASAES